MARRFGLTWWGRAWTEALEQRARLDPNRLPRGRTYARHDHVGELTIEPGWMRAPVQGSRPRPYRVEVRFRTFTDDEWDQIIDLIVSRAGWAAALLDGELDPDLAEAARTAGVDLLPDAGELQPRCSCPDWADPCKHSAAVCYLVADALDADPFALLRLRGRGRDEILAAVRRRRSGLVDVDAADDVVDAAGNRPEPDAPVDHDPGLRASRAWDRSLGDLPSVPGPRPAVGRAAAWPVDPPADAPFTVEGLRGLVDDAAQRAWSAVVTDESLRLVADERADLARRASALMGDEMGLGRLAKRAGRTRRALVRLGLAWRLAGQRGIAVIDEGPWRPDTLDMATAREALAGAGVAESSLKVIDNRIGVGRDAQVRLGRDGSWYRFAKRSGTWELDAGPADEPDDLIDISADA